MARCIQYSGDQFTTRAGRTDLHPYLVGLDTDGVGGHRQLARAHPTPVLQAIAPFVPRACDVAVLDETFGQRPAHMQTDVVERVHAPVDVEQGHGTPADVYDAGPGIGDVGESANGELRHCTSFNVGRI